MRAKQWMAVISIGLSAVLALLLSALLGVPDLSWADSESKVAFSVTAQTFSGWSNGISSFVTASSVPVTCTLHYTTTDESPFDNHSFETAADISNFTGQALVTGNVNDEVLSQADFYRWDNVSAGYEYGVTALPDKTNNYDLAIAVYDRDHNLVTEDNDAINYRASVVVVAENDGPYYFEIYQRSVQCHGDTYNLVLSSTAPTPTPTNTPTPGPTSTPLPGTPTPAPTWTSGYDKYEPNFSFDTAQSIAPGVEYELNFTPWGNAEQDNDYFKLWVKPGLLFTCETFELAPVVDTNMILYDTNRNQIGGNDDRALGDYRSKLSYYSTYEGYLYLLVGTGDRLSFEDAKNSSYKLKCEKAVPGTPTPVGGEAAPSKDPTLIPTATQPASPVATPVATATPAPASGSVALTFQPLTTPAPITATPTPSGFRNFRLIIYYDENADGQLGAGEGVPGFYVQVLNAYSSEELARGYTDEQGNLSFSVPTVDTVQVLVPSLGLDRQIAPSVPEIKIRIVAQSLPVVIP